MLGHSQERDDLVFFVKCKDHTEEEEDFEVRMLVHSSTGLLTLDF